MVGVNLGSLEARACRAWRSGRLHPPRHLAAGGRDLVSSAVLARAARRVHRCRSPTRYSPTSSGMRSRAGSSRWFPDVPSTRASSRRSPAPASRRPWPAVISLVILLWAASGMMAAIRVAFRVIWENDRRRTYVQSKLLDFALVLGVGLLAVASARRDPVGAGAGGDRPRSQPSVRGGHLGRVLGDCRRGADLDQLDLRSARRSLPHRPSRRSSSAGRLAPGSPRRRRLPRRDRGVRALPRPVGRRRRSLRAARRRSSGFCWSCTSA